MTVARLLAAPIFVVMIVVWGATWFNLVVGFLVACSDGVDGYIARRQGTTRSGAFLDPLADKAVVLGAFGALAAEGHLPWLPVILIAIREIGMQLYRSWVGPPRGVHPGPQLGQAQDLRAGPVHRRLPGPAAGAPPRGEPGRRLGGHRPHHLSPGCSTWSTAGAAFKEAGV